MHRSFVHLELNTGDTDAARVFYRQVFQWDFEDIPMVDGTKYTQIRPPTGLMGGMQAKVVPNAPTAWMPYVGVESVEATVERVVAAGGVVVEPYQPVPGFGALAIVEDPTGAHFGLWETAMPVLAEDAASGAETTLEPPRDAPAEKAQAKKAAAKKAAAKKAAAKKAAAKKAPAKKAPAKKAPATKPAAKKTPTKKTGKKSAAKPAKTGKKRAAKTAPAARKSTGKKSASKKAPTGKKRAAKKGKRR